MGCSRSVAYSNDDNDLIIDLRLTLVKINEKYSQLSGRSIEKLVHRGITINQLLFIQDEFKARCVLEGWTDKDGNLLTPERVNLYDIKYKIIMDRISGLQCSYVESIFKK